MVELSTEMLADKALELRPYGNIGVAYTYSKLLIGYKYVRCLYEELLGVRLASDMA